jgi:GAF domain-containing protein
VNLDRGSISGRVVLERGIIHVSDILADPEFAHLESQKRGGYRTVLGVPLLREGNPIGVLFLSRAEVDPFTQQQIDLVTTFADQAVIAIENTRLLNELRESLQQQTATADVLKVIGSSPGELQPVFDAMLVNVTGLCEAKFASLLLSEGDQFRRVSFHNAPPALIEDWRRTPLIHLHPESALGRAALTKQVAHIDDIRTTRAYRDRDPRLIAGVELGGYRTVLSVPMLKDQEVVGLIVIYRQEVRPFTDKQIERSKILPPRPSSPSRTRVCSTSCANPCSSRPPRPTYSRSSAGQRSTCKPSLIRWPNLPSGFARQIDRSSVDAWVIPTQ